MELIMYNYTLSALAKQGISIWKKKVRIENFDASSGGKYLRHHMCTSFRFLIVSSPWFPSMIYNHATSWLLRVSIPHFSFPFSLLLTTLPFFLLTLPCPSSPLPFQKPHPRRPVPPNTESTSGPLFLLSFLSPYRSREKTSLEGGEGGRWLR